MMSIVGLECVRRNLFHQLYLILLRNSIRQQPDESIRQFYFLDIFNFSFLRFPTIRYDLKVGSTLVSTHIINNIILYIIWIVTLKNNNFHVFSKMIMQNHLKRMSHRCLLIWESWFIYEIIQRIEEKDKFYLMERWRTIVRRTKGTA